MDNLYIQGGVVNWKSLYIGLFFLLLLGTSCAEKQIENQAVLTPEPIAPENGSTITQNPPTFIWQSLARGDILYLLEVSVDSQFNLGSTVISTMTIPPDTSYTPSDPLVPGEYYWHIRAQENC
jgi:hypothetical protein